MDHCLDVGPGAPHDKSHVGCKLTRIAYLEILYWFKLDVIRDGCSPVVIVLFNKGLSTRHGGVMLK